MQKYETRTGLSTPIGAIVAKLGRYAHKTECGHFTASLYGARYAAAKWEDVQAAVLVDHGSSHGLANTCSFSFEERSIGVIVHANDILPTDPRTELEWQKRIMNTHLESRHRMVGEQRDLTKTMVLFKRRAP